MKITKSILKKLIKEEVSDLKEDQAHGQMWVEIAKIMQLQGYSLHNPHQWLRDGLASGVVARQASPQDADILP